MGVPKFFRWLSERYPAISQLIAENRIPEFDCLYLDMNGIIHNCTHKDSDSPTFRMTEDKMFIAIFNYIEHLFATIKPKKLFFMAIDGVAPRAKMNQQRARRFRSALDAEKAREKAIKEGLEMPKEEPFDSNCITPGTEFMARLTNQLKYFVSKKVSEDADWRNVEVVLSGHEVPGEGEHKIMEYIRQAKSQPNYDPNVRHCLYGLDADLIMLGLLSHDPHFCLLREEVTFGRQSKTKNKELEHQNFYLMHLCAVREYLEFEFDALKQAGTLSFTYDMERIIDDFILMAFFVGNDFLPNLPHLHINEGALALMFEVYKAILPTLDGYINDSGTINLQRLAVLLKGLSKVEYRFFETENQDASWLKSKQRQDDEVHARDNKRGKLVVSTSQNQIWKTVKAWIAGKSAGAPVEPLSLPVSLPARDREFVKSLASEFHLQWTSVEQDDGQRHLQLAFIPNPDDEDDDDDEEAQQALKRVQRRYDNASIVDVTPEQAKENMEQKYQQKFIAWKNEYYTSKFSWGLNDEDDLRQLTENYVQGLQWVLYYYYRGVVSWPWYFQYHYSPMISDVTKGLGADMDFKLGQPFRPYQQLMGVLPDRSKSIVPTVYHDLMTNPKSPIIDFYPRDFELDMNGKKMEWEAVVKIPFIDEKRLLDAMATKDQYLTESEKARNEYGVSLKFTYSSDVSYTYPSSMPGVFNDISNCRCVQNIFELPTMEGLDVHVGLVEGVKLGAAALAGFPSLKTLPIAAALAFHGVNIFQQDSRNESMVVTLLGAESTTRIENAKARLGKVVHVGYPFLQEAKVVKVSDELFDYTLDESGRVAMHEHGDREINQWKNKAERIESHYSKRLGMIVGTVDSLVHVDMLKGLKKTDQGATIKDYGLIEGMDSEFATQTIVDEVISQDGRFLEKAALPVEEEFPVNSRAFFLGELAYGRPLQVIDYQAGKLKVWIAMTKNRPDEFWARKLVKAAEQNTRYTPSYAVAKMLSLNPLVLSKITSAFMVHHGGLRLNLGLNLKFESKKMKVLGYSRKSGSGWEFTQKAIGLLVEYMTKFPEFIAGIQRNPSGDTYQATDFYNASEAGDRVKEIGQWLKSVEAKSFEKVPLDAEQLDSDVVSMIESMVEQTIADAGEYSNKTLNSVPRHAVLKPADAEQRLGQQIFTVGDRIIYVQDSGKVPVGLSGTVIGMTRTTRLTLLDIVLDSTFMSGSTLGDRCSPFRGATVPASSVLNLTVRQIVADTKASTARQTTQNSSPMYANGYGAPVGPGSKGQLFPAAPPPTLNGSWSNAVNGQNGHGTSNARGWSSRGRGQAQTLPYRNANSNTSPHANKKGYTIIDNSDPSVGIVKNNPNFRPQRYTNVAPPGTLDGSAQRGRGGHRGRGRGRGSGKIVIS